MGNEYTTLMQQYDFLQSPKGVTSKSIKTASILSHKHQEKYSLIKLNTDQYLRVYYRIVNNFKQQLNYFQWRYQSIDPLIKVQYVEVLPPYQKNNTIVKVYTEHLVRDFNQLKNLSITQVLYIFQQSLLGLVAISKMATIYKLFAQNFGITSSGHCKMWYVSNFSENFQNEGQQAIIPTEQELIKQLLSLIKKTANIQSAFFFKKFERQLSKQKFSYQNALHIINQYSKTKQMQIPNCLLVEVKQIYQNKQKSYCSFSTQLTNKKKKPENMTLSELKFKDKSVNTTNEAKKNCNNGRQSLSINAQTIHLEKKRNSLGNFQSFYCQFPIKNSIIDNIQYDKKQGMTNTCLNSTISYSSKQSAHFTNNGSFQKSGVDLDNSLLKQISEKEEDKGLSYTDQEDEIIQKSQRSSQTKNPQRQQIQIKQNPIFLQPKVLCIKPNNNQRINRVSSGIRSQTKKFSNRLKILTSQQSYDSRSKIKSGGVLNSISPILCNSQKENAFYGKQSQQRKHRTNSYFQGEQKIKQQEVTNKIIQNNQWKNVIKRLLISDKQLKVNKSVSIGNISEDTPSQRLQPSLKILGRNCNVTKSIVPN